MYVHGKVVDTKGNPVPGAIIETWETDGHGLYDNQVSDNVQDASISQLITGSSIQIVRVQNVEAASRARQTERTLIEP